MQVRNIPVSEMPSPSLKSPNITIPDNGRFGRTISQESHGKDTFIYHKTFSKEVRTCLKKLVKERITNMKVSVELKSLSEAFALYRLECKRIRSIQTNLAVFMECSKLTSCLKERIKNVCVTIFLPQTSSTIAEHIEAMEALTHSRGAIAHYLKLCEIETVTSVVEDNLWMLYTLAARYEDKIIPTVQDTLQDPEFGGFFPE